MVKLYLNLIFFFFFSRIKEGNTWTTLPASELKIRCGEYDLKSNKADCTENCIEQFVHQDRSVSNVTIHPFYR